MPLNETIEYKFIFTSASGVRWEHFEHNRIIKPSFLSIIVENDQDSLVSRVITFEKEEKKESNEEFELKVQFTGRDSLILASMMLPIVVTRNLDYDPQVKESSK